MKKTYAIEVDCANCANEMQAAAAQVAGVKTVVVNFMLQKMIVEFEPDVDQKRLQARRTGLRSGALSVLPAAQGHALASPACRSTGHFLFTNN